MRIRSITRRPTRAVLLTIGALAAGLALSSCSAPAPDEATVTVTNDEPLATPTPYASSLPLEGYLVADAGGTAIVERDATALDSIGVDGVVLAPDGGSLGAMPPDAAALVTAAHEAGLRAELLLSNFDDTVQDFSPEIATALLSSAVNRTAVVTQLVDRIVADDFDGVQVDLESLSASDTAGLTAFMSELRSALDAAEPSTDAPLQLSTAVMASTDPTGYAAGGYALSDLAPLVDRVVLMAYDQHGPTWSDPGPVGGLPWAEEALGALIEAGLPAAKADLGVAGYGYSWPGDGSDGTTLTVAEARDVAGNAARFDGPQGEWTATLDDGTVLWWSDSRSLAVRATLAERAGVHGLALWQLPSADPLR